jgi:hypothetical protein
MKAKIDAIKAAEGGNAKYKDCQDKIRSEMEQLKVLSTDIKSKASKRNASQPTYTTNVPAVNPVSCGKIRNAEMGNEERSIIASSGIPSLMRRLLSSGIGVDASPQSRELGGPDKNSANGEWEEKGRVA